MNDRLQRSQIVPQSMPKRPPKRRLLLFGQQRLLSCAHGESAGTAALGTGRSRAALAQTSAVAFCRVLLGTQRGSPGEQSSRLLGSNLSTHSRFSRETTGGATSVAATRRRTYAGRMNRTHRKSSTLSLLHAAGRMPMTTCAAHVVNATASRATERSKRLAGRS